MGLEEGTISNGDPRNLGSKWTLGRSIRTAPADGRAMRFRRLLRRIRTLDVGKVFRYLRATRREWRRKRRLADSNADKVAVFVLGCNRSGTNMVCAAIGNSDHGWAYREREFSPAFNGYYLRADWIIERLIRRTPTPMVGFGSILDSQFARDLLDRFDGARVLWTYRTYDDVANSCARMVWGRHLRNLMRWVSQGELEKLGARGRNVSEETVTTVNRLFHEGLSDEECAALYWYYRNRLFFDLELDEDDRVLPVQYEEAALRPEESFRRVFDFLGFSYQPEVVEDVYSGSVGKHPSPEIDPAIRQVCDTLYERLEAAYATSKTQVSEV